MRTIVIAAAMLALTACGGAEETAEAPVTDMTEADSPLAGEAPGFEAVAPGDYEVALEGEDGINQLTIHPGMTWSMVFADGEAAGGTIYMQGGQTCFVTEGEEGSACFTNGQTAPDGTMTNISSDGTVMTVRPVDGFAGDPEE
jgi:hypothetical protein